ncbi:MAG: DUF4350 domain-containing protein [Bacteroidetes bacterium]|nr:DUF4350 domain-containing protein [Bacteroidota bacterium]
MKGYRIFILVFVVLLAIYIVAEINRPKPFDWSVTLSKEDKNPYGSYILYHQLNDLFPTAVISSFRLPVYDQVDNFSDSNTAYMLIDPQLELSEEDVNELLNYVSVGNYVFLSSSDLGKRISDSLHLSTNRRFDLEKTDSVRINFDNPNLHSPNDYRFYKFTIDEYVEKFDSSKTIVLGSNQYHNPNFVKIDYGNGAFFVHAAPLCFSNYFMLTGNNYEYTAKALSYLPKDLKQIYWDEYYKLGPTGSQNPLRFILSNVNLRWAFRIALFTMLIFVFFEMKRTQRIIPVIQPLRNSTLDFVQTVGSVYFNRHDNKNVAQKKVQYFLEYIRSHFYLSTTYLNDEFMHALSKKTGVTEAELRDLMVYIERVSEEDKVSDELLLQLNQSIDSFYNKAK